MSGSDSDSDDSMGESGSDVELSSEFVSSALPRPSEGEEDPDWLERSEFISAYIQEWDEPVANITVEISRLKTLIEKLRNKIDETFDTRMFVGKYRKTMEQTELTNEMFRLLAEAADKAAQVYSFAREYNFFIDMFRLCDEEIPEIVAIRNRLSIVYKGLLQTTLILFNTLAEYYRQLSDSITLDHAEDILPDIYRSVPAVAFYTLITKLLLISRYHDIELRKEKYKTLTPKKFPYVEKNLLIRSLKPILEFSMRELLDSVNQLAYCWNKLKYSDQLLDYVELLEFRTAMLIHESNTAAVFNVEPFRRQIPQTNSPIQYAANEEFKSFICMKLVNFRIRLIMNYIIPKVEPCPAKWLPTPLQEKVVMDWLVYQATNIYGDKAGADYRLKYFKRILNPAEGEEFHMRFPGEALTDQQVLIKMRGDNEYRQIIEMCNRPRYQDIIMDEESMYPASCATMSYILIDSFFKGAYSTTKWECFCFFYEDLLVRFGALQRETDPLMVQNFNFFNICFNDTMYVLEGFVKAFTCWINIVLQEQEGKFEDKQQDVSHLIEAIKTVQVKRKNEYEKILKQTGKAPKSENPDLPYYACNEEFPLVVPKKACIIVEERLQKLPKSGTVKTKVGKNTVKEVNF